MQALVGRKLPLELDNPLDNLLVDVADAISPAFKATGHTPNMLTGYSALLAAAAVWALARGNTAAFAALHMASYFFDCADGHFARKYNMVTPGGDLFDHTKDTAAFVAAVLILFFQYSMPPLAWALIALLLLLSNVHLGCQQKLASGGESIDITRQLCPTRGPETWLPYTRWFGCGTFNLAFALVVAGAAVYRRR